MLQDILNIYYISVLIAVFLMVLDNMVSKQKDVDPFEIMDDINKLLDDIDNEKTKELISTFIDRAMENKALCYAYLFLMCALPIVNLFVIVSMIKSLIGNKKEGE